MSIYQYKGQILISLKCEYPRERARELACRLLSCQQSEQTVKIIPKLVTSKISGKKIVATCKFKYGGISDGSQIRPVLCK